MKHMTLSEFIDSESDEPVFIVDGPQPIVGTACIETAMEWADYQRSLPAYRHPSLADRTYGGLEQQVRNTQEWRRRAGQRAFYGEHNHPLIKAE